MRILSEVCAYLRNYFLADYLEPEKYMHYGTYTISNTRIDPLPFLVDGQYFRIIGSARNDGVYQWVDDPENPNRHTVLADEIFEGSIWAMSVPPDVSDLIAEISSWMTTNNSVLNSPYQSESFGGYSYSKSSGGGSSGNPSAAFSWQDQFATRLAPYRRLSVL